MNAPTSRQALAPSAALIQLGEDNPAGTDYVGMWYSARLRYGIDDRMLFGSFHNDAALPQWYYASHRHYDGLAILGGMLTPRFGVTLAEGLPQGRDKAAPGWPALRRAARLPLAAPAARMRWRDLAPQRAKIASPMPTTRLLSIEETAEIEARAEAAGVSSTVWLLWAADRAVRQALLQPDAVLSWVYPVNLRGATGCERESMNQCGGFMLTIAPQMSAMDVRGQVSARLARLEHWRQWRMLTLGRWIGQRGINLLYRLTQPRPGKFAGSYSNLGSWEVPGIDGLTASAPGSPGYPVCITTVVCNGRRSLAVRVHPVADREGGAAQRIMTLWRLALRR